jgi:ABC-2 type transport system ATP-binding protein
VSSGHPQVRPWLLPSGWGKGFVVIVVDALTREFTVTDRDTGLGGALRSVVRRHHRVVTALSEVSFTVQGGTVLGLLGPNGSGKTTTLKCVAGLLTPTSGTVEVLGMTPADRSPDLLRRLGFVMGQRWQLHPDIPVMESFELHRVVYDLDRASFVRTRDELMTLLQLDDLVSTPARKLSLGQRMRCEFVAALLHRPSVVLLDEPTLGLDFDAQLMIRAFVRRYVDAAGAAVILTSHYLADIEALSDRVITISHGRLTFEGSLVELRQLAGDRKRVTALLSGPLPTTLLESLGTVVEQTVGTAVLDVPRSRSGATVGILEQLDQVLDVTLQDPPLEDTLRDLYELSP